MSRDLLTMLDGMGYPQLDDDYLLRRGNCYGLALRFFFTRPELSPVLVHGFPRLAGGPDEGRLYGHAWIEFTVGDGIVLCHDTITDATMGRHVFYAAGRIDREFCSRWTTEREIRLALVEHECVGNWADEAALGEPALFGPEE